MLILSIIFLLLPHLELCSQKERIKELLSKRPQISHQFLKARLLKNKSFLENKLQRWKRNRLSRQEEQAKYEPTEAELQWAEKLNEYVDVWRKHWTNDLLCEVEVETGCDKTQLPGI